MATIVLAFSILWFISTLGVLLFLAMRRKVFRRRPLLVGATFIFLSASLIGITRLPRLLSHTHNNRVAPVSATTTYFESYNSNGNSGGIESRSLRDWSLLWQQPIEYGCTPFAEQNHSVFCYSTASDGFSVDGLYALRSSDGALLWHKDLQALNQENAPLADLANAISPIFSDGTVFVTLKYQDYNEIEALRASDGTFLWKQKLDDPFFQGLRSVVASGGRVFIATNFSRVASFNSGNGALLWRVNMKAGEAIVNLSATGNQQLYLKSAGQIFALRAANGSASWKRKNTAGYTISATSAHIYTWSTTFIEEKHQERRVTTLDAINPTTGLLDWSWHVPQMQDLAMTTQPLEIDGKVYTVVGTKLYALRVKDGKVAWNYNLWCVYPDTKPDKHTTLSTQISAPGYGLLLIDINASFNRECLLGCPTPPSHKIQAMSTANGGVYWQRVLDS